MSDQGSIGLGDEMPVVGDTSAALALAGEAVPASASESGDEDFQDAEEPEANGAEMPGSDVQPSRADAKEETHTTAGVSHGENIGDGAEASSASDSDVAGGKPVTTEEPAADPENPQGNEAGGTEILSAAFGFGSSGIADDSKHCDSVSSSLASQDVLREREEETLEELLETCSDGGVPKISSGADTAGDGGAFVELSEAPTLDAVDSQSASGLEEDGADITETVVSPNGSGNNLFSGSEADIDDFQETHEDHGSTWFGGASRQDGMAPESSSPRDDSTVGAPHPQSQPQPQPSLDKLKMPVPLGVPEPVPRSSASSIPASPLAMVDPNSDTQWQAKKKHFFVLSNAGKPIFSRYGNESGLAGFMGVICGMLSFMETTGDQMQSMRAGCHLFVFVCRGPIYLVAVSRSGEPEKCLMLQLELLHHTIISILTNAVERIFRRSPSYDMRTLMGGTGTTMRSLIKSFGRDPSAMLVSIPTMRMPSLQRRIVQDALGGACGQAKAMYAVLLGGAKVVGLVEPKGSALHPHDILLLSNFVRSNESFRQAESFAPVCLPHFNSGAYLHAYIHYISPGVCLVLLASHPDTFSNLSAAREKIESTLHSAGVLETVLRKLDEPGQGSPTVAQLPQSAGGGPLGETPLWHFVYRSPTKRQVIVAGFTSPLFRRAVSKEVVREYGTLAAQMHDAKGNATQRSYLSTSDERVTLAVMYPDCELYAIYDPMTEKAAALQVAQRVMAWVKGNQAELMIPLVN